MINQSRRPAVSAAALLALALSAPSLKAQAQASDPHAGMPMGSSADAAATMPVDTASYLQMAASGDQFEIQSSQLALQMSRDTAMRSFAQMLIDDHTRLSAALATAARSAGFAAPAPSLSAKHMQMMEMLRTAGANFDTTYRQQQVVAHTEALGLHRSYAASGNAAALKTAAASAIPVIERHLQQAQTMSAGGSAQSGSASPMGSGSAISGASSSATGSSMDGSPSSSMDSSMGGSTSSSMGAGGSDATSTPAGSSQSDMPGGSYPSTGGTGPTPEQRAGERG